MKTQYRALVKQKGLPGRWMNAASYVKKLDGSDSSRYFETREEAENAIRTALNKFGTGDDLLAIIDWRISKRLVGDWEIVEGFNVIPRCS